MSTAQTTTKATTKTALLKDRGVVSVSGPDAAAFLDNMITNDLPVLEDGAALFAALLTPQGKILFEFFVVRSGDGFLLETQREKAADLTKRLGMYKLRANVAINDLSANYAVIAMWGGGEPAMPLALAYDDPRHGRLGRRALIAAAMAAKQLDEHLDASAYHAHRVACGVPEGGKDYALGDTFPHEASYDRLNGVSFTKGCFVGQEVVARMQNKTVVRKRVAMIEGQGLTTGAEVKISDAVIGTVGSVAGSRALALLRLDRVVEAEDKNLPVTAGGAAVRVAPELLKLYRDSVANKPVIDL
jgi:tRNA-modifying protein YgfZ